VLPLNDDVFEDLKKKHPPAKPTDPSAMITGEIPYVNSALFANIDESIISKAALNTKGASGPSGLDATYFSVPELCRCWQGSSRHKKLTTMKINHQISKLIYLVA
jgi:hypothetical protein